MAKPGGAMGNQMGNQMPQMRGPQPQPGQSSFGPPSGMPTMRGPMPQPGQSTMGNSWGDIARQLQTVPGLATPPPRFDTSGAIPVNMPPRPTDPRIRTLGGMNPMAQAIQRTGANPAVQNTVMNRLRPTMASNQNVPPLQVSNPNMAPQPSGMFRPFRRFGG